MCPAVCSWRGEIEPDLIARAVERIEHPDIAVPADAEDMLDPLADQEFRDQLPALHPRHDLSPSTVANLPYSFSSPFAS